MLEGPGDDPGALVGRLYDEHGAALYRYAVMLLADRAAAEDAVHQVFATMLRASRPAAVRDHLHYLRRALRNECYSMLRRRIVRREAAALLESIDTAGSQSDPGERLAVERAIAALPPEQREVVHLHVFEGLTFQEIAAATDESINTIAGRYRYALGRLREMLTT